MILHKYDALGNDYLVAVGGLKPSIDEICEACDREHGIGSDGLLYSEGGYEVHVYNPDGSEAERSGNGLRIFSQYLYDQGLTDQESFIITTPFTRTEAVCHGDNTVSLGLGKAEIEGIRKLELGEHEVEYYGVNVGNPHAVILRKSPANIDIASEIGPLVEKHEVFKDGVNVEFVYVRNRVTLELEIWERGAGYTLSSGTCASAAAALTCSLGLTGGNIEVKMPGGSLFTNIDEKGMITQRGPVSYVGKYEFGKAL